MSFGKDLEIIKLDKQDLPLWDEFNDKSPQGNFFYNSKWLNAISESTDRSFKIWVAVNHNEYKAGIVVFENPRLIYKLITPVFFQNFNGPLFYKPQDEKSQKTIAHNIESLRKLIKNLTKHYDYLALNTHYSATDLRPFLWHDFSFTPRYTYVVKFDSQNVMENVSQTIRKKVNQAQSSGCEIVAEKNIDVFINLYQASYARHDMVPPVDQKHLRDFLEIIANIEQTDMHFVVNKGQYLAARVNIKDKETVYDFLAGNKDDSGTASSFLVAKLLQSYHNRFKYFDFLGADHAHIEKFKRSFGGAIRNGFRLESKMSPMLSILLRLQEFRNKQARKK